MSNPTTTTTTTTTGELVFVPAPGIGHIPSTVELAKLILTRHRHITISIHIIDLPNHSSKIKSYVEAQSADTRLTFITHPPLYHPSDPCFSLESIFSIIRQHGPLVKRAVEDRVQAGLARPVGFVLDMFCTGMVDIAKGMRVPSYLYLTTTASSLLFIFYAQWRADHDGVDIAAEFSDPAFMAVLPGFKNRVPSAVLPPGFKDKNYMCEILVNIGRKFREMKGILVNSYDELESYPFQALRECEEPRVGSLGPVPRVYPVGPILVLDDISGSESHGQEKHEVIQWLDGQPKSSVVFLCFGGGGCFDEEQVKEIANGLDQSGYRFLWALRLYPQEGKQFLEALPQGFIDRTSHKGKIIAWAPQIEVLSHSAVGGFVTHSGSNSILESLWFEVPMATWPMGAEQQLIAFQLIKEMEVAVEIRMDYNMDRDAGKGNFLVTAEEVEKGVRKLMSKDDNLKKNVKKMSEEGRKAKEEGGSSYCWLGHFIEDVVSNTKLY